MVQKINRETAERIFHTMMESPVNYENNKVREVAKILDTHFSNFMDKEMFTELVEDMEQCYNKITSKDVALQTTFCAGWIIFNILGDRGYVVDEYHAKLTPKRGKSNVEKVLAEINKTWEKNYTLADVTIVKF